MSTSITIDIADNILHEIDLISQSLNRPRTVILSELIKMGLQEYTDCVIARDRMSDNTDKVISSAEMRLKLGIFD